MMILQALPHNGCTRLPCAPELPRTHRNALEAVDGKVVATIRSKHEITQNNCASHDIDNEVSVSPALSIMYSGGQKCVISNSLDMSKASQRRVMILFVDSLLVDSLLVDSLSWILSILGDVVPTLRKRQSNAWVVPPCRIQPSA